MGSYLFHYTTTCVSPAIPLAEYVSLLGCLKEDNGSGEVCDSAMPMIQSTQKGGKKDCKVQTLILTQTVNLWHVHLNYDGLKQVLKWSQKQIQEGFDGLLQDY